MVSSGSPRASGLGHRLGDPPRHRLLAIAKQHIRQLLLRQLLQQPGRRQFLPVIHPHIQRAVPHEAEPALHAVQLHGRNAQIQQYAAHLARRPWRAACSANSEKFARSTIARSPNGVSESFASSSASAIAVQRQQVRIQPGRRQHAPPHGPPPPPFHPHTSRRAPSPTGKRFPRATPAHGPCITSWESYKPDPAVLRARGRRPDPQAARFILGHGIGPFEQLITRQEDALGNGEPTRFLSAAGNGLAHHRAGAPPRPGPPSPPWPPPPRGWPPPRGSSRLTRAVDLDLEWTDTIVCGIAGCRRRPAGPAVSGRRHALDRRDRRPGRPRRTSPPGARRSSARHRAGAGRRIPRGPTSFRLPVSRCAAGPMPRKNAPRKFRTRCTGPLPRTSIDPAANSVRSMIPDSIIQTGCRRRPAPSG